MAHTRTHLQENSRPVSSLELYPFQGCHPQISHKIVHIWQCCHTDAHVQKKYFSFGFSQKYDYVHKFLHECYVSSNLIQVVILFSVGKWKWIDIATCIASRSGNPQNYCLFQPQCIIQIDFHALACSVQGTSLPLW